MRKELKHLLNVRQVNLRSEISPTKLLPFLKLPRTDKEQITCEEKINGKTIAADMLLDRIVRRDDDVFYQLPKALRETGQHHAALLVDPCFKISSRQEDQDFVDENEQLLNILGTASEVRISMRVMDRDKKYFTDGEKTLLEKLTDNKSDAVMSLRSEFDKHLPQGAAFVILFKKKEDVVGCKLRISQVSAGVDLLTKYRTGELKRLLEELLIGHCLKDVAHVEELSLVINLMEEEVSKALEILTESMDVYAGDSDVEEITRRLDNIRIPPVHLIEDNTSCGVLQLLDYQEELAGPAKQAHNCVICAPTNSGKTYVALEIAMSHLQCKKEEKRLDESKPSPKVLFIVNRVNLVLQQRMRFDYYLSNKYKIADISGANLPEKKSLSALHRDNDVIVLTAQILVDALSQKRIAITDFSLLIFDECHHTQKGHPYNDIMSKYLAVKFLPVRSERETLPQIVGLTASLGAGKSETVTEAKEHVLKICANLDTPLVVTVQKHEKELSDRVGNIERTVHEVTQSQPDYFDNVMGEIMGYIEEMVRRSRTRGDETPPAVRGSQQYGQWALETDKRGVAIGSRDLIVLARHLQTYNSALMIKRTCRVKDAMKYMEGFFSRMDRSKFFTMDEKLSEFYQEFVQRIEDHKEKYGEPKNPKLEKISQLLLEKHRCAAEKDEHPKGILFTTTRDSTEALKAWLNESDDLKGIIKADKLVGTGNGEGGNGMTQRQQEDVIRNFRSGQLNLLISTSVGEEGIDIPDCTFAIKYDVMSNEISAVQSRGRVRAKEGQLDIVAGSDSGVLERESINRYRELLMGDAMDEVRKMDEKEREQRIADIQKMSMGTRLSKEKAKRKEDIDGKLSCRQCQAPACTIADIRRIREAHHVVVSQGFCDLVRERKYKKSKTFDEVDFQGQIFCASCNCEWGVSLKYQGRRWYCIKASSFGFLFSGEEERRTFKKWKQCVAYVKDIDSDLI